MGTIILGVASISATICAFQFYSSKKIKLKDSLKNDVVQYKSDSKKDNKVSKLVSAKHSNDNLQTVEEKYIVYTKKKPVNEDSQHQLNDDNIIALNKQTSLKNIKSTSHDVLQTVVENSEVDISKESENNKIKKVCNDLNQHHRLFKESLEYINAEQKVHDKNIGLLETDISVASLYKEISGRIFAIIEDLNKQKCNEKLKQFI